MRSFRRWNTEHGTRELRDEIRASIPPIDGWVEGSCRSSFEGGGLVSGKILGRVGHEPVFRAHGGNDGFPQDCGIGVEHQIDGGGEGEP